MKARLLLSSFLIMFISIGTFAQQVKKPADSYKYKMEDNKLKLEKTILLYGVGANGKSVFLIL